MKRYDQIILGAGIAGLGVALALAKRKKRVLVLCRDLKGEASPRAAGILDPFLELEERSPLLPLSLQAFKEFSSLRRIIESKTGLSTGYAKTGMLYVGLNAQEASKLRIRYDWQKKKSIPVLWLRSRELHEKFPGLSPKAKCGLYYPTVGRVQAPAFMKAMRRFTEMAGVKLISSDSPLELKASGDGFLVLFSRKRFKGNVLINAAGSWASDKNLALSQLPMKPVRGQIFVLQGKHCPATILHTANGYYLVPWDKKRCLAGSTVEFAGFRPQVSSAGRSEILKNIARLYPDLPQMKEVGSWAGLRPYSSDGMPVIGEIPGRKGLYAAAGYFRSGILLGSYVGKLLAQGICTGKIAPALEPFSPSRFVHN